MYPKAQVQFTERGELRKTIDIMFPCRMIYQTLNENQTRGQRLRKAGIFLFTGKIVNVI